MLKHSKYLVLFLALLVIAPSCKDDYLEKIPLSGPSSSSFYTNQDELMLGLMGCYKALNFESKAQRPWPVIMDVVTDIEWNRSAGDLQDIGKGNHASNNGAILTCWREFYRAINRCNFLLDNIDGLKDKIPATVYAQSKAEARFVRAISYHYLVELFGGVPLVTKVLSLEEAQVAKSTKAQVVDFIMTELTEAAKDLPLNYAGNTGRATKGAALGFKARTALYNEKWAEAAAAAKEVMDAGYHKLHPSFPELFLYAGQSSTEHMFALQYQKGVIIHATPNFLTSRMADGVSNEIPLQSTVDRFQASDGLSIDKSPLFDPKKPFANRDPRLGYSIAVPGSILFNIQFETHPDSLQVWNYNFTPARRVANTDATNAFATYSGYLYKKYCDIIDMPDDQNSQLNHDLMRYAEVLLIYAEAKIEANQIDATVYDAINQVRRRPTVLMPAITTGKTQAELRYIVRQERVYELSMEGLRLYDIRRWKIAESVMTKPVVGKIKTAFLSNAPTFDANGFPIYTGVTNNAQMRLIETRIFNKDRDYLWPIPSVELAANKALVQNPNW
jgi:hypothetical protein